MDGKKCLLAGASKFKCGCFFAENELDVFPHVKMIQHVTIRITARHEDAQLRPKGGTAQKGQSLKFEDFSVNGAPPELTSFLTPKMLHSQNLAVENSNR